MALSHSDLLKTPWHQRLINSKDPFSEFLTMMREEGNNPDFQAYLNAFAHLSPEVFDKFYSRWTLENVANGSLGANDAYADYAGYGVSPSEEMTKYLDNQIAQSNTAADRAFQTEMRDTSLLSSGNQLSQLGLSPSNVISVGGASSGVTSQAANQSFAASGVGRKQQLAINQYNQRMGMAKSLISMAGSMASSGIYGASLNAAKHSAAALAAAASHSGISILKHHNGFGSGKMSLPDNLPSNEGNMSLDKLLGLS